MVFNLIQITFPNGSLGVHSKSANVAKPTFADFLMAIVRTIFQSFLKSPLHNLTSFFLLDKGDDVDV